MDLVLALQSASLPSARYQPHLLVPSAQTINQEKGKNPKMRSNFQQIVSYCLGLYTQNPGLREVTLEVGPKRGSDKINIQKQGRNTQKKASRNRQPGLTYRSQQLGRQTWTLVLGEVMTRLTCTNNKKTLKQSNLYRTAWTHIWLTALTELVSEPSAKKEVNGTKLLVNFYWYSWSLNLKESPNQFSHTN